MQSYPHFSLVKLKSRKYNFSLILNFQNEVLDPGKIIILEASLKRKCIANYSFYIQALFTALVKVELVPFVFVYLTFLTLFQSQKQHYVLYRNTTNTSDKI